VVNRKGGETVSTRTRKKHGVVVIEHKEWNTKKIYNDGDLLRTYRRQPKRIRFHSPMVNDFNQHHCGGWSIPEILKTTICDQLVGRRKPLGVDYFNSKESADEEKQRLLDAGLIVTVKRREPKVVPDFWELCACQDMRISDIGNLDDLAEDYHEAGIELEDFSKYRDRHLKTRMDCYDIPESPLWLTGLVLGYPVENTISIYYEHYSS
jgi:hypothetical protein